MLPKRVTTYGRANRSRQGRPPVARMSFNPENSPAALPEGGMEDAGVDEGLRAVTDDVAPPSNTPAATMPNNTPKRARRSQGRPATAGPDPDSETPASMAMPTSMTGVAQGLVPFEDESELSDLSDSPIKRPLPEPKTERKAKSRQSLAKRRSGESSSEEGESDESFGKAKRAPAKGKARGTRTAKATPTKGRRARAAALVEDPDSEDESGSHEGQKDERSPEKGRKRQSLAAKRKATTKDVNGSAKKPTKRTKLGASSPSLCDDDARMSSPSQPKSQHRKAAPRGSQASVTKGKGRKADKDEAPPLFDFLNSFQDAPDDQNHDVLMRMFEDSGDEMKEQQGGGEFSDDEDVPAFRPTTRPDALFDTCFVFAKYPKTAGSWYIGEFLEFRPAKNEADQRAGKDYCVVRDFNGEVHEKIKLEDIVTRKDERIATIKLGNYDFTDSGDQKFTSDADFRPPSPPPQDPSPDAGPSHPTPISTQQALSPDDYSDLPSAEQLCLIRPHLQLVLDESYPPAQWRMDAFHRGGNDRESLKAQGNSGDYSEDEIVGVLLPELKRWALRRERWRDAEQRPPEPPRPSGSGRYEALSPSDRDLFVQLILLPEAIVEICIRSHAPGVLAEKLRESQEAEVNGADESDACSLISSVRDSDDEDEERMANRDAGTPRVELGAGAEVVDERDPGEQSQEVRDEEPPTEPEAHREGEDQSSNAGTVIASTAPIANASLRSPPQLSSVLTPASLPRPSPAPDLAPLAEDPMLLYKAAREHLLDLSKEDTAKRWSMGEAILKRARENARERLGLAPEHLSKEEMKEWEAKRAQPFGSQRPMRRVRSGRSNHQ
ncbi:hypothetical protein L202_06850 [Cryptococcus amylolentus CBS 6039]|uniref:Uncharacterized protein n=1 Tax=Cryptococcus amylolentus CBS 6039 TaxID=1295533 RepID=A0A1E3HDQ3_9TREE|nr:hypothetical protein L202_06850 [Cryptococcus amylolentus CBS 6039]ODN74464.1 hypothetical protein L202_06850 [Cryptococcus amylolentus CBS 6039]